MIMLVMKITQMKKFILWWNKNIFGDVVASVKEAEIKVIQWEIALTEEWTLEKT